MLEHIRLKIVDSHDEILNIINRNIGTLVNFDYNADYPIYPNKILDVDLYSDPFSDNINNHQRMETNWVPKLASKGYISRYIWMFPHNHGRDEIKRFNSKNGPCEVYNIKFNGRTKLSYKYITIDSIFFGCKNPFNWSSSCRIELFNSILESITARNIMFIISKSKNFVNYDIENFLVEMKREMIKRAEVEELQ